MPKLSAKDAVSTFVTGDQVVLVQADDDVVLISRADFITALSGEFGGGSAITLDLGDDGGDDSTDLTEIATSGDTNSIFTMPSADKLLIDASQNWPTADTADSALGLRGVDLDSTVGSPSDGDILVYRTAGSDWVLEAKPAGGGGGVDTSGTPVANDFARFTDADTIEGRSYAEVRSDLGLEIGTDVQAYSAVLAATTASFTTALETKLNGIEAGADVTDTANVTAAGALMDSEVDADIKTLSLPANTTISAFGATLVDDADASAAQTTLGLVIGTDVQAYDADTLKADTADQLSAGFTEALDDDGTQSSGTYTPDPDTGTLSKAIVNGGAFTLGVPSAASGEAIYMTVLMTNNGSAGTVTTSGWTVVGGDSLDTTDGNDFLLSLTIINKGGTTYSALNVQALQ
jgi:hypothetical protein